jgi:hypothetical protein
MKPSTIMASLMAASALPGCAFPAAAPTALEMERPREDLWDFFIVQANANVVGLLSRSYEEGLPGSFARLGSSVSGVLRAGDVISITVYEAGGPSLFGSNASFSVSPVSAATPPISSASPSSTATLPPQQVEPSGRVIIPFVGEVHVKEIGKAHV